MGRASRHLAMLLVAGVALVACTDNLTDADPLLADGGGGGPSARATAEPTAEPQPWPARTPTPYAPDTANALYLAGSPEVDFGGGSTAGWTVNEVDGRATYTPVDGSFQLMWDPPPAAIYVDVANSFLFGGEILRAPVGPWGTSVDVSFSAPFEVLGDAPAKPYIGRSGSDGKLYPNATGMERARAITVYRLPRGHKATSATITVHLGYGPRVIYRYEP